MAVQADDGGAFKVRAFPSSLELAHKLVDQGRLKSVDTRNITVDEAKGTSEMMFLGSTLPIVPIIEWDEKPIGNGEVGELTMLLSDLL